MTKKRLLFFIRAIVASHRGNRISSITTEYRKLDECTVREAMDMRNAEP